MNRLRCSHGIRRLALLLLLVAQCATPARAEQRQFGRYDVYFSVFAADFLRPETAQALGIVRAPDRAVLNISIRRRYEGRTGDEPVSARVEGTLGDLIRKTALDFRVVQEEGAVYYLAQFPFRDGETHYVELTIQPVGEAQALDLRFEKTLYVN